MRGNWVGPEERGRRKLSHDTSTAGGGPRQIESPRPWPGARRYNRHRGHRQPQRGASSSRPRGRWKVWRCGKDIQKHHKGGDWAVSFWFSQALSFDMSPLLLSHDFHPPEARGNRPRQGKGAEGADRGNPRTKHELFGLQASPQLPW